MVTMVSTGMANQKGLFLSHGTRGLCVSWDQARFLGIK